MLVLHRFGRWSALAAVATLAACSNGATPAANPPTGKADTAPVAGDDAVAASADTGAAAPGAKDTAGPAPAQDGAVAIEPDAAAADATSAADVLPPPADDLAAAPDAAVADAAGSADAPAPDVAAPDAVADATPTPDAAAGDVAAGVDAKADVPWFPSWKDPNGCENYQHWVGGACVAENPAQEKLETVTCWKAGQVNDLGVGKPCMPGAGMCKGMTASCCIADAKKYGALCSMACTSSVECGAGAYCHLSYGGGICMPAGCTDLFDGYYEQYRKKDKGFVCNATANAKGVGTLCKAGGAACAPFAGSTCLGDNPLYLPQGQSQYSSFCTVGCQANADCGAGAECIFSNGKPYFCAPTACAAQFATVIFSNQPGGIGGPGSDETCQPE